MTTRIENPRLWAALAAAAIVGGAAAAGAQQPAGQFAVGPSQIERVGKPPLDLGVSHVRNTTAQPLSVTITPAGLGQQPTGGFVPIENPASVRKARQVLSVSPRKFKLPSGGEQQFAVRWKRLPKGQKAAYVGLIITGVPPRPKGGGIQSIVRLVQSNILRLPGKLEPKGSIAALRGEQQDKQLRFLSVVKNSGNVDAKPSKTQLVIATKAGRQVFQGRWQVGNVVLPGATVEYPAVVKKVLPAGDYTATTAMTFGGKRSSKRIALTLAGPNQLPTTGFDLVRVAASGQIGDAAQVKVTVKNTGTQEARPKLVLRLFRENEPEPRAEKVLELDQLGVGDDATADLEMGKLDNTVYRAVGAILRGDEELDEQTVTFRPAKADEGGGFPLLPLLLGLALLGTGAFFFTRRRRAAPATQPAAPAKPAPSAPPPAAAPEPAPEPAPAPSAPVPAAAPAANAVNINTASADELATLPGVGPAAARRLVAHREEYGSFGSVDDLAQVEGFDAARIRRLAPRATS